MTAARIEVENTRQIAENAYGRLAEVRMQLADKERSQQEAKANPALFFWLPQGGLMNRDEPQEQKVSLVIPRWWKTRASFPQVVNNLSCQVHNPDKTRLKQLKVFHKMLKTFHKPVEKSA